MARARNIKPGFFKNESLAECSLTARLCFAGLWTLADREGRLEDRPKRIKGELFAFDSIEVAPLLDELAAHGFILRYVAGGLPLIQILAFHKHQNPHHREPPSDLPPPEGPGLLRDARPPEPRADTGLQGGKAQDKPEASPGLDPTRSDLARGSSRVDSGFRIPDSGTLIPEHGLPADAAGAHAGERTGNSEPPEPSPAVQVAIALRKAGIDANAHHPRLLALVNAGATVAEFLAFADKAKLTDNAFPYLLGCVEGERKRAAATAGQLHQGAMPTAQVTTPGESTEAYLARMEAEREAERKRLAGAGPSPEVKARLAELAGGMRTR